MAIETLRPNAAGDQTEIDTQYPASGSHWEKVDEAVADDASTYVRQTAIGVNKVDLYNLPASVGAGKINKITVHGRWITTASGRFRLAIKSGTTTEIKPDVRWTNDLVWTDHEFEWALNPDDGEAWEWADIDALQIGMLLYASSAQTSDCTQVYVEVDYTKIPTLSRIVTMGGKSRANIAKVSGKSMADIVSIGGVPNV